MRRLVWFVLLAELISVCTPTAPEAPCVSGKFVGQCVPAADCKKGNKLSFKCAALSKRCPAGHACCFPKKKKPPKSVCDEPEPTPPGPTPEEELKKLKQKIQEAKDKLRKRLLNKFDPVLTIPRELLDDLEKLWILTGSMFTPSPVAVAPAAPVPIDAADNAAPGPATGPTDPNKGKLKESDIETLKKELMNELKDMINGAGRMLEMLSQLGNDDPKLCEFTRVLKKFLWDSMERLQKMRAKYRDMMVQLAAKAFLHPKLAEYLRNWSNRQFKKLDSWAMQLMDMAKCYMQYLLDSCCDEKDEDKKGW